LNEDGSSAQRRVTVVRNAALKPRMFIETASLIVFTERPDQIEDGAARLRIGNAKERAIELYAFATAEKLREMILPAASGKPWPGKSVFRPVAVTLQVLEEEFNTNAQYPGQLEQPAGADAVSTLLVFLNLLERQAEMLSKLLLTHSQQHAPQPDPSPDMYVDRVRFTRVRRIKISLRQRRLLH
jgi:hypothetical protein